MSNYSNLIAATNLGTFKPPSNSYSAGSATSAGAAANNLERLLSNAIGAMTIIGGIFFIVYFVMAAFSWVTAGGDAGKIQKARDKMILGIIGLVLLVMAYGLIGLVGSIVGLNLLNPGAEILKLR